MVIYDFLNLLVWIGVYAAKYVFLMAVIVLAVICGGKLRMRKDEKVAQTK